MAQALRDIRRRIKAVRSTQQITRAMQMVAAAKLRKAQTRAISARAYSDKLAELLDRLTSDGAHVGQALLAVRPVRKATLLVVTADRGLAGSYNTNLFRRAEAVLDRLGGAADPVEVDLIVVGRKGRDYFRRRGRAITREEIGLPDEHLDSLARDLAVKVIADFTQGATDEVLVVYSKFVSPLVQRPVEARLLPVAPPQAEAEAGARPAGGPGAGTAAGPAGEPETTGAAGKGAELETAGGDGAAGLRYIYEPSARTVYSLLLPKFVTNQLFHALIEARASEYSARMTAMAAATDNAEELIGKLTLEMHHARQATITQEIMELVGGAEALREK